MRPNGQEVIRLPYSAVMISKNNIEVYSYLCLAFFIISVDFSCTRIFTSALDAVHFGNSLLE